MPRLVHACEMEEPKDLPSMPLSDMQLVGLLQLVIEQEKQLLLVRAHLIALEQITVELAGPDMKDRLAQYTQEILASPKFDATRETVKALEQMIVQLLPSSGEKN
jgi:hypothetical protein